MGLNLLRDKGTPIDRQNFTWKDLVQKPISKLNVDAFTRVRIILMNGIESESVRFSHSCARMNKTLQAPLATVRRKEQHQQTIVNWLLPADQSPLETTIGYEQVAIEVTPPWPVWNRTRISLKFCVSAYSKTSTISTGIQPSSTGYKDRCEHHHPMLYRHSARSTDRG